MANPLSHDETATFEFRLFLEELCCELCRFEHAERDGVNPENVHIGRDVSLGIPQAFADIRVSAPDQSPYFVEVKYGYSDAGLLRSLKRKYGKSTPVLTPPSRLILVTDADSRPTWPALVPGLKLEIWNVAKSLELIRNRFGVKISDVTEKDLVELRSAINHAKGFKAFGGQSLADYSMDGLQTSLLWHFGFWRLRQLREQKNLAPREIMCPGAYRNVAILLVDLCSFSSYVRDTPDDAIVRRCLTSFYSKARYQIINHGGMLSQFIGDEAVALFGMPDQNPGYVQEAFNTAKALLDIGNAVSSHWQRSIDRVQKSGGVHIGIALGDLQAVSMQPFGRAPMGVIGDSINMAARLMATAGPNEIVVSNGFHRELDADAAAEFQEIEPVDARNIGRIKAWKFSGTPASTCVTTTPTA